MSSLSLLVPTQLNSLLELIQTKSLAPQGNFFSMAAVALHLHLQHRPKTLALASYAKVDTALPLAQAATSTSIYLLQNICRHLKF